MKKENYITIQGWMVKDLGLSGNELICYALIFGFTQDEESEFKGSLSYISEWLGTSKQNARLIIKRLVDKGYLIKRDEIINSVKFCRYTVGLIQPRGMAETTTGGMAVLTTNNNIVDNIEDIKEDTNVSKKVTNIIRQEDVDYLYSLYPSKCPTKNKSNGKGANDKIKIRSLLKTMPKEELEFTIKAYVQQCTENGEWMKNFSTFLKNLPDMGYCKEEEQQQEIRSSRKIEWQT